MADHPLRSATYRRLGGPLPRQPANQTRAHLRTDKPLASGSCGPDALCGISSRFRLLSPIPRQIAHALLTRPPLSYRFHPRKDFQNNSVRLACVRHAASVHPEPGSNSLKFVSYPLSWLQSISELVLLLSYQETFVSRNYFVASSQTRISGFLVSFVV